MPKFKVVAHRRIHKFLRGLENEKVKGMIKGAIIKPGNYPLALREMNVEKIKGLEKTFRVRVAFMFAGRTFGYKVSQVM